MQLHLYDYFLFFYLLIALYLDVKYSKLPNWLTVSGMAFGIIYHLLTNGIHGLIFSIAGLLVAGLIFIILYVFKAIGAGDAKLFAAIGSFIGIEMVLYLAMYSIVFAGIIGVLILLFTKTFLKKLTNAFMEIMSSILSRDFQSLEDYKVNKSTRFPFMYAVIPAVLTTYYFFYI